ncbi:MAG: DUF4398 domain-containing protein [Myxococcales bacterium FL481]|nr:MAG: DUF4398 domain-containing protein [Myxococcales bacterium FL481]
MHSLFKPCAATLLLGLAACGPFGYLGKVSKHANFAVASAQAVGAEELAPYEYWGAVAYLEQSKTLMAYSEYERAFDYGSRAIQLAEEAKLKAERVEAGRSVQREQPDPKAVEEDSPEPPTPPGVSGGGQP